MRSIVSCKSQKTFTETNISSGGPESGSTNVIKMYAFASDDSGFIGSIFINANDNVSFVAANDNNVAAVALAA